MLHYADGSSPGFDQRPLLNHSGDYYENFIPRTTVTERGVAYFIVAQDSLGNVTRLDTASIQVLYGAGTITSSPSVSAFSDGFPYDKWRLISLPSDANDKSIGSIIPEELSDTPSDETWGLFRYTGPGRDDYEAVTSLALGESYFMKQVVTEEPLFFALGIGMSYDLTGLSFTLAPQRWRFISAPYPFQVEVEVNQPIPGPYAWGPYGENNQEGWSERRLQTTFQPWGGYIVYNNSTQTQTLEIKPPGLAKAMLAKAIEEPVPGWLLHLTASGERYFDAGNIVGRLEGALDGLDARDHPEPPVPEGYISITMVRPEWEAPHTADIRSLETVDGSWDLALDTRDEPGPIKLAYQLEGELPPAVALVDLPYQKAYLLSAGESPAPITAYNEHFSYRLKVVAGSESYVSSTTKEILAVLPKEFKLAQNYPNPFNPNTIIEYALPRPAKVSLRIYDLLGREIRTLHDGWQDIGYHQVNWNGTDRRGISLASGIYFAVFQADKTIRTKKMVLLK
jgi:hypothetical protein